jgi:hypothetical protein
MIYGMPRYLNFNKNNRKIINVSKIVKLLRYRCVDGYPTLLISYTQQDANIQGKNYKYKPSDQHTKKYKTKIIFFFCYLVLKESASLLLLPLLHVILCSF